MASWYGKILYDNMNIPVALHLVADEDTVAFNQLHKDCGARINCIKYCPLCKKELNQDDIIKGYKYNDDTYVTLTDDELKSLKMPKGKNFVLDRFVNEIDSLYVIKHYCVIPSGKESDFLLLKESMKKEHKIGIADAVLGSKECFIAFWVKDDNMIASTLYNVDEIHLFTFVPSSVDIKVSDENRVCEKIRSMTVEFKPKELSETNRKRIEKAIQRKVEGTEIAEPSSNAQQDTAGKTQALKKSMEISDAKKSNSDVLAAPAPQKAARAKKPKSTGNQARQ